MKTRLIGLLSLVFFSLAAFAQTPGTLAWPGVRGQALDYVVVLNHAWIAQTATVKISPSIGGALYPTNIQPTAVRSGDTLRVHFDAAQSAKLQNDTYVVISTGGTIRFSGYLNLGSSANTGGTIGGTASWNLITDKPSAFPSTIELIPGLTTALGNLLPTAIYTAFQTSYANTIAGMNTTINTKLTQAQADLLYQPLGSSSTFSSLTANGNATVGGHIAIGTTVPTPLSSTYRYAFLGRSGSMMGSTAVNDFMISNNAHFNGTGNTYDNNGPATFFSQGPSGNFTWYTASSGTAGAAVTPFVRMALSNDGILSVGATPGLTIDGSGRLYTGALAGGYGSLDAGMAVTPRVAGATGLVVRGLSSQSADIMQIQNSTGSPLVTFGPNGETISYSYFNTAYSTGEYRIGNVPFLRSPGTANAFVGANAGNSTLTGAYNTAMGFGAGANLTAGNYNTVIGVNAGLNMTSSSGNVLVGLNAGNKSTLTSGLVNSTFLGQSAGVDVAGNYYENCLFLGFDAGKGEGNSSNTVFLGKAETPLLLRNYGSVLIGPGTAGTVGIPRYLSLSQDYSNSAGTHLKLKLFDPGNEAGEYGLGVSAGQMDLAVPAISGFGFFVGNTKVAGIDSGGSLSAVALKVNTLNTAPASASAAGTTGEIRVTAGFIYVCTATNTWVRAALSTW